MAFTFSVALITAVALLLLACTAWLLARGPRTRASRALAAALGLWGAANAALAVGNALPLPPGWPTTAFVLHDALLAGVPFALFAFVARYPERRTPAASGVVTWTLVGAGVAFALVRAYAFAPPAARDILLLPAAPSPDARSALASLAALDVLALPIALLALAASVALAKREPEERRGVAWAAAVAGVYAIDHAVWAVDHWRIEGASGGFLVAAIASRVSDFVALAFTLGAFAVLNREASSAQRPRAILPKRILALWFAALALGAFHVWISGARDAFDVGLTALVAWLPILALAVGLVVAVARD